MTTIVELATPLRSLAELRVRHRDLMTEHERSGAAEWFLDRVEQFLALGQLSGAALDNPAERRSAQSVLDYWTAILYSAGRMPVITILASYEAEAVQRPLLETDCPYPGLDAYEEEDADRFFGRELVVTDLVSRLRSEPVLSVTGPPSSGKTSLIQAGLIPALKAGRLEGSSNWHYFPTLTPGLASLRNLTALFAPPQAAGAELESWLEEEAEEFRGDPQRLLTKVRKFGPSVLFVDQFEVVLEDAGALPDPDRQVLLDQLIALVSTRDSNCRVIVATRTEDGLGQGELSALFHDRLRFEVPGPGVRELRDAIEKPAGLVGLKLEHGVVTDLVGALVGVPAALALLQVVLLRVWSVREQAKNLITAESLRQTAWDERRHRVNALAAVVHGAQAELATMTGQKRRIARELLLDLVTPGDGWELQIHRLRKADLLAGASEPAAADVLDSLVRAGVVRLTDDGERHNPHVELVHPLLPRQWPDLGVWLDEAQAAERERRRVVEAAQFWREHLRDRGSLLRGAGLRDARLFVSDPDSGVREFVGASISAARLRRWKMAAVLLGGATLIVVTFVLTVLLALQQYWLEREAFSRQLAAESTALAADRFDLALLLGMNAFSQSRTGEARDAILAALEGNPRLALLIGSGAPSSAVATSPDGSTVAIGDQVGGIHLERVRANGITLNLSARGRVIALAFTPAGDKLVSLKAPVSSEPPIQVWDLATGTEIGPSPTVPPTLPVALAASIGATSRVESHAGTVAGIAVSARGALAVLTTDTLLVWDLASAQELWRDAVAIDADKHVTPSRVAFGPDGLELVVAECAKPAAPCQEARVQVFDVEHGQRAQVIGGLTSGIADIAFGRGADGPMLLVHATDGDVLYSGLKDPDWQPLDRALPSAQANGARQQSLHSLALSQDGTSAAVAACQAFDIQGACTSSFVRLWNLMTLRPLAPQPLAAHATLVDLAFDTRADVLAMASPDGAKVWNFTRRLTASQPAAPQPIDALIARAAQGEYRLALVPCSESADAGLQTCARGATVRLLDADLRTTEIALPDLGDANQISALALSSDGSRLAVGTSDGRVAMHQAGSPGSAWVIISAHGSTGVSGLAFGNADGRVVLASVGHDRRVAIWDAAGGTLLRELPTESDLRSVALSPDGAVLAAGDSDGSIFLWNLAGPLRVSTLAGGPGPVGTLAFGQRGGWHFLASANAVGSIAVWDGDTGRLVAYPPLQPPQAGSGLEFTSSNGAEPLVLTSFGDSQQTVWELDVDPSHFASRVCDLIGPTMRRNQEDTYLQRDLQFPSNLFDRLQGPGRFSCPDADTPSR